LKTSDITLKGLNLFNIALQKYSVPNFIKIFFFDHNFAKRRICLLQLLGLKGSNTLVGLQTSDTSSQGQFLVVADPAQLAALEVCSVHPFPGYCEDKASCLTLVVIIFLLSRVQWICRFCIGLV